MLDLPLGLKMICLLSLVRDCICSPVTIPVSNSQLDILDTSALSPANESAISTLSSTRLGAPVPNCATLPSNAEWFQPSEKFDYGDCPKALELFYNDYTRDHEGIKYEFLASGVTPVHGIPTQRVPLKVSHGMSKQEC